MLTAIHDDRFYIILTRREWNGIIEQRLRAILTGDNPSILPPPGFESLIQKLAAITGGQGSTENLPSASARAMPSGSTASPSAGWSRPSTGTSLTPSRPR